MLPVPRAVPSSGVEAVAKLAHAQGRDALRWVREQTRANHEEIYLLVVLRILASAASVDCAGSFWDYETCCDWLDRLPY